MTDDLPGFENVPFDPASMPMSSLGITKAVWYRRPWVLASLALVVIVAISVVIDLPRPITPAQDQASQNASIKEINTDLADCAFAVKESFSRLRSEPSAVSNASRRRFSRSDSSP